MTPLLSIEAAGETFHEKLAHGKEIDVMKRTVAILTVYSSRPLTSECLALKAV